MEKLITASERIGAQLDRRRFLARIALGSAGVVASLVAPGFARAGNRPAAPGNDTAGMLAKQAAPELGSDGKPFAPDACWWYCYYEGACNECASGKSRHRCVNYCTGYTSYLCVSPCSSFCYSFNPC